MKSDDWEKICNRCGKCCYEKVDVGGGEVHYTDEPCCRLDTETGLCSVYDNRHELEPDCISLTEHLVRTLYWLPEDCAYVEHIRHLDTLTEVRAADRSTKKKKSKRK